MVLPLILGGVALGGVGGFLLGGLAGAAYGSPIYQPYYAPNFNPSYYQPSPMIPMFPVMPMMNTSSSFYPSAAYCPAPMSFYQSPTQWAQQYDGW